jgi:hypothetical protein
VRRAVRRGGHSSTKSRQNSRVSEGTVAAEGSRHGAAVAAVEQRREAMLEAFHQGGFGMYPTGIFGVLLIASAVKYAMSPERRFVPLQFALGIMTLAAGSLGFVTGLIKSFEAMGGVTEDKRWIWMLGAGESLHNLALAFLTLTVAAIIGSVGAARIARGSVVPAA